MGRGDSREASFALVVARAANAGVIVVVEGIVCLLFSLIHLKASGLCGSLSVCCLICTGNTLGKKTCTTVSSAMCFWTLSTDQSKLLFSLAIRYVSPQFFTSYYRAYARI